MWVCFDISMLMLVVWCKGWLLVNKLVIGFVVYF